MALPTENLETAFTNASVTYSGGRLYYRLDYEVIHVPTQTPVYAAFKQKAIVSFERLPDADAELRQEIEGDVQIVKEWHKERGALGGASVYDAMRTLDRWDFYPAGSNWNLSHPVSGDFSGVFLGDSGIINRFLAVSSLVLPLPTWTWVTAGIEEVEVNCVAVAGAQSYKVYDDITYLATVPNNGKNTVPLAAGVYRIRMGAVDSSGKTGILGNATTVTVLTSGTVVTTVEETEPQTLRVMADPGKLVRLLKRKRRK